MTFLGNAGELLLLDALTAAISHVSLHSGLPGETGLNEIAGGGYARQAVTFDPAVAPGVSLSNVGVTFSALPATDVSHLGFWDSLSGGDFLALAPLGLGGKGFATGLSGGTGITSPGHGLSLDDRVQFRASIYGNVPSGLTETILYYVVGVPSVDTFEVGLTSMGSAISLTGDGDMFWSQAQVFTLPASSLFILASGDISLRMD